MKVTKRFLSWLLIVCTVLGLFPAVTLTTSAATATFVKVTTAPSDWSGLYLIVNEDNAVTLNGALTTLDAASNNLSVTINDGVIDVTNELELAAVTIAPKGDGYTIKTTKSYYMGCTSDTNALHSTNQESLADTNTISMNADGTANIVGSGGAYLRYNATSGQERFRYYKSTTYERQKAVCLYKYTPAEGGEGGDVGGDTEYVEIATGKYVIAAKYDGKYYAMSNQFSANNAAAEITLTADGKVAAADAKPYVVTITKETDGYTIFNPNLADGVYLNYSNGTSFAVEATAEYWQITEGVNGTYRIAMLDDAGTTERGIIFGSANLNFTAQRTSNITSSTATAYIDVEILEIDGEIEDDTEEYPEYAVASGQYVIAANVDGVYYAMSNAFPTSATRISASEIEVVDGKVPGSQAIGYVVTVSVVAGGYTITNEDGYLMYSGTSTGLKVSDTAYVWKFTNGSNGTIRALVPETLADGVTRRALHYNAGTQYFGAYASSDLYYDIELLPIDGEIKPEVIELETGFYVIATKVGDQYIGMSSSFTASKLPGTNITVTDGAVTAADAKGCIVKIEKTSEGYTIYNGTSYLTYASATNLGRSEAAYVWNLEKGIEYDYMLMPPVDSGDSTRTLSYRLSAQHFGAFAKSNMTAGDYSDLFIFPITGSVEYDDNSAEGDIGGGEVEEGDIETSGSSYVTMKIITGAGEVSLLTSEGQYGNAVKTKGIAKRNNIDANTTVTLLIKPADGYRLAVVERSANRLTTGDGTELGENAGYKYDATVGGYIYTFVVDKAGSKNYFRVSFLPRRSDGGYTATQITGWTGEGEYVITGLREPEDYVTNYHSTASTYLLYGDDDTAIDEDYAAIGSKSSALQLATVGVSLSAKEPYLMSGLNENHLMKFTKNGDYYTISLYGAKEATYYIRGTDGTAINTTTTITDNYDLWEVTYIDGGAVKIMNVGSGRYLKFNHISTNLQFRCYEEDYEEATYPVLYKATHASYHVTYSVSAGEGTVRAYNETSEMAISSDSYQPEGSNLTFTVTPTVGWYIQSITVNGRAIEIADGSSTLSFAHNNLTADVDVVVTFAQIGNVDFFVKYYINDTLIVTAKINAKTPYKLQTTGTVVDANGVSYDLSALTYVNDKGTTDTSDDETVTCDLNALSFDGSNNGSEIYASLNTLMNVRGGDTIEARFSTTRVERTKTVEEITKTGASDATHGGENIEDDDNWFVLEDDKKDEHGNVKQTYRVTLNAKSNEKIEEIEKGGNMDVIIVLDHSASMLATLPNESTNREFAITAVDDFCDVAFADSNANNKIAIVQYNQIARVWNNSSKTALELNIDNIGVTYNTAFMTNKTDVMNAVNNVMAVYTTGGRDGETNTMGGLKATELVAMTRPKSTDRDLLIVLFTDGIPSCRYISSYTDVSDDYDGVETSAFEYARAFEAGESLRAAIDTYTNCNSTIYAVSLLNTLDGENVEYLESIVDSLMGSTTAYQWKAAAYDPGTAEYNSFWNSLNSSMYPTYGSLVGAELRDNPGVTGTNYMANISSYFKKRTPWTDNYQKLSGNNAVDKLGALFENIAYEYVAGKLVTGTITDVIPAGFKLTAESKANLETLGCKITEKDDGTTTIVTPEITADETGATFVYDIVYQGGGYGSTYTNQEATFYYETLTGQKVTSYFPMPTATVIPWTVNDREVAQPGVPKDIDVLSKDLFAELTEGGYALSNFTVTLTDAHGNPMTYNDSVEQLGCGFDAEVDPLSGTITYYTESGRASTFYYVVSATATAPDGTVTVVHSRATRVDVYANELDKFAQEVTHSTDLPDAIKTAMAPATDDYGNVYQIYKVTLDINVFDITNGKLTDEIPEGFTFLGFGEMVNMPTAAADKPAYNSETRTITVSNITVDDSGEGASLSYYLKYVGKDGKVGAGVFKTNTSAKLSYTDSVGNEAEGTFPIPTAGIKPFTVNDVDLAKTGESGKINVTSNDLYANSGSEVNGYVVGDVTVYITDENGNKLTDEQLAVLGLSVNEDGSISYTTSDPGALQFYYVVETKVTVPSANDYAQNNDTVLTSRPTMVTVYSVDDTVIVVDYGMKTQTVDFVGDTDVVIDKDQNVNLSTYISESALAATGETYGTISQNGSEVAFTPDTIDFSGNAEYSASITMEDCVYNNYASKSESVSFKVIPANNLYYEFEAPFVEFKNDTAADATKWTALGSSNLASSTQSASKQHNINRHGYDNTYADREQYSGGATMGVTVTATDWEDDAYFTFSGTGFDIIGSTNCDSGVLVAEVFKYDATKADGCGDKIKFIMVDTYLPGDVSYEQLPIISYHAKSYDTYRVKLRAFYDPIFDKNYGTAANTSSAEARVTRGIENLTDAKIREILGWSADEEFEIQTIDTNAAAKTTKATSLEAAKDGQYNVYVDALRIYNPINMAEESATDDSLPTKVSELADGKYVIAAFVNNTYYAMSNTFASTIKGTVITFEGGKIKADAAGAYAIDLKRSGDGFTVSYGANYLGYSGQRNNLSISTVPYVWNIEAEEDGTFVGLRASTDETRALAYLVGGSFAGHSAGNINGTTYLDVVFIPVDETTDDMSKYGVAGDLYIAASEFRPDFVSINDTLIDSNNYQQGFTNAAGENVGTLFIANNGSKDDASTNDTAGGNDIINYTGTFLSSSGQFRSEKGNDGNTYLTDAEGNRLKFKYEHSGEKYEADVYVVAETDPATPEIFDFLYYHEGYEKVMKLTKGQVNHLGIVYYDDKYESVGPENEVYLKNGQGIAMAINTRDTVQFSAKVPVGTASAKLMVWNSNANDWVYVDTITSATEMYYSVDIANLAKDDTLLIIKAVIGDEDTVLSLCNVKFASGYQVSTGAIVPMSNEQYSRAVRIMNGTYVKVEVQDEEETNLPPIPDTYDENLTFNMNITAGAAMSVAYDFTASKISSYESFYLTIEKEYADAEPWLVKYDVDALNEIYNPLTGDVFAYSALFTSISAKEMGDCFRATLYGVKADGSVCYGPSVEASIQDHLMSKLEKASDDTTKTMAVDMLAYGAAAQVYFDYDAENLVTADLTDAQLAYATKEIPEAVNSFAETGEGVNLTTNVILADRVVLYFNSFYTPSEELSIVVNDPETGDIVCSLNTICNDGICSANFSDVAAKQMRKSYCFTLCDGETAVSKTITWSIESYVAQVRADENSSQTKIDMVNAMLIYGDSVAAYLDSVE